MLNTTRKAILMAFLAMTLGCGGSSPTGPTPTPVAPAPVAAVGVYTVTASTDIVAPGGLLSVSWTASTAGGNDWIALFRKGELNTAESQWVGWTDGAKSGTFTLSAPFLTGQYEFRYLLDDGYDDAARTGLVTVR